jgi:alkylation response protein AidB-like acyl-CoA dehydrogenase
LGLKRDQEEGLNQGSFDFVELPEPVLRAVRVDPNERAREKGYMLFGNMRVPEESVIFRLFAEGGDYHEAEEDLSWWTGRQACPVKVKARVVGEAVEALIISLD